MTTALYRDHGRDHPLHGNRVSSEIVFNRVTCILQSYLYLEDVVVVWLPNAVASNWYVDIFPRRRTFIPGMDGGCMEFNILIH